MAAKVQIPRNKALRLRNTLDISFLLFNYYTIHINSTAEAYDQIGFCITRKNMILFYMFILNLLLVIIINRNVCNEISLTFIQYKCMYLCTFFMGRCLLHTQLLNMRAERKSFELKIK